MGHIMYPAKKKAISYFFTPSLSGCKILNHAILILQNCLVSNPFFQRLLLSKLYFIENIEKHK